MTWCLLPLKLRSKGEFEIMSTVIVMVVDSGDICNSRIIMRDCQGAKVQFFVIPELL